MVSPSAVYIQYVRDDAAAVVDDKPEVIDYEVQIVKFRKGYDSFK